MRIFLTGLLLLLFAGFVASWVSPWPGVMVIRAIFDRGASVASERLSPMVPTDISVEVHSYDAADPAALLDIYRGRGSGAGTPVILWVHGGGFVSGRRSDVANYLKILASRGFTVANVDYTIAPDAIYPGPVRQVVAALGFLLANSDSLGLDATRIVLAGDSAGAQIAAQVAAVLDNPAYATLLGFDGPQSGTELAGVLLFCGVYDIRDLGRTGGFFGWFVDTAGRAYSGTRDWRNAPDFATIDFLPYLTGSYPPAFISAGNADPLEQQSRRLADALEAAGARVERLFFPPTHMPPLGHEYQFDLTSRDGQVALDRAVDWLSGL